MAADNLLKRWVVSVDGVGKAGNAKEYVPPSLEVLTVDFQAGDMDAPVPVDDGMAPMEASFSLFGVDMGVLTLLGFRQGGHVPVTVRTTYDDRVGNAWCLLEELHGMVTKVERDTQDTGSQREKVMKVTMKLGYYKASKAGTVLVEIDPVNHIRNLGGVDALKTMSNLLKLS